MKNYPNISDIQNFIIADGQIHLTYYASELHDIIHKYSLPGYEYLSGTFIEFLNRFRPVLPKKMPIILEVTGKTFSTAEKTAIDKAIWMHYGLYLSETAENLKRTYKKILVYLILMILSSVFLFLVGNISDEVMINYGYLLFWFFGYRLLTHLLLDCLPIYKEYQWYRGLATLKLCFADDRAEQLDTRTVSEEAIYYAREANRHIREHFFVDQVLMEDSRVSLGCTIRNTEDVLMPFSVNSIEIICDEMADYLMSALPFIRKDSTTGLEIACNSICEKDRNRIASAIRNYMAFMISCQDAQQKDNRDTSILFTFCFFISTLILSAWGSHVDVAIHEFFLVLFWFFGDYLLEFILLTRLEIRSTKKTLEKLANMDITFKNIK